MPIVNMDGTSTMGATEFSLPNGSTTLTPQTDDAVVQAGPIDVSAMAAGDQFQFRVYEKANGSTQRVLYEAILTGAQNPPMVVFPSTILTDGWDVTVKKLAGTDRSMPYSVRKIT